MRLKFLVLIFSILLVSSVFVVAKPVFKEYGVLPLQEHASVKIPEHAVQLSSDVFSLGHAIDVDGRVVEGLMFVYKKENARPENPGGGKKGGGGSTCYSHLAKGAKWKTVEPYLVDPNNTRGLDAEAIKSNLKDAILEWEDAAGGSEILGDEVAEVVNRATIGDLNGKNEVMFADIEGTGTIGVTIVWGRFGGNPNTRELVEWDQVYDDVSFDWSLSGDTGKMDFENIAQHELGHSIGMGHAPTDLGCAEETMYPTASNGETKKRTLHTGDITGIKKLY